MSGEGPWQMHVTGGLSAHFKQPDGPSRPGTEWNVQLKHGAEQYTAMVCTFFAKDLKPSLRKDSNYLAQTAMQYLKDQLSQGWHPRDARQHVITVGNPPATKKKPFWKFW